MKGGGGAGWMIVVAALAACTTTRAPRRVHHDACTTTRAPRRVHHDTSGIPPQGTAAGSLGDRSRRRRVPRERRNGELARGKKLVGTYCASCHMKGAVRPELEPGLYEPEMIVARVRRMPGSDNVQMPPISVQKLPDSELRDIVA